MGSIPLIEIEHTGEYNLSTDDECGDVYTLTLMESELLHSSNIILL